MYGGASLGWTALQIVLEPATAQAIAVVLHELVTNASNYGALSKTKGQIRLTWSRSEDGQLVLRWTKLGSPKLNGPERRGFGSRVIEGSISQLATLHLPSLRVATTTSD